MPFSIAGTNVQVYDKTLSGLVLNGTIDSGALPVTANAYAIGARITDLSSGLVYVNSGTAALPVWTAGGGSMTVNMAAADLIAMFTTPVQIIPAIQGKAIIVDSFEFVITRTSTAFTGGGVVGLQYANTANGAGTLTTANIAATVVTGAAGATYTARIPVVLSDVASASIAGIGLYMSNATAAFAAGTGTAVVTVKYHLV